MNQFRDATKMVRATNEQPSAVAEESSVTEAAIL
jgi:hypothetical protein